MRPDASEKLTERFTRVMGPFGWSGSSGFFCPPNKVGPPEPIVIDGVEMGSLQMAEAKYMIYGVSLGFTVHLHKWRLWATTYDWWWGRTFAENRGLTAIHDGWWEPPWHCRMALQGLVLSVCAAANISGAKLQIWKTSEQQKKSRIAFYRDLSSSS